MAKAKVTTDSQSIYLSTNAMKFCSNSYSNGHHHHWQNRGNISGSLNVAWHLTSFVIRECVPNARSAINFGIGMIFTGTMVHWNIKLGLLMHLRLRHPVPKNIRRKLSLKYPKRVKLWTNCTFYLVNLVIQFSCRVKPSRSIGWWWCTIFSNW